MEEESKEAEGDEEQTASVDEKQAELENYICEMLLMISTGDDELDMQSIEVVAVNIHTKAVQMHKEYQKHLELNQKALKKEIKKTSEEGQ